MDKEKEIEHTVTQQDIENNPERKEAGVEVGETITYPADAACEASEEGAALVNGPED